MKTVALQEHYWPYKNIHGVFYAHRSKMLAIAKTQRHSHQGAEQFIWEAGRTKLKDSKYYKIHQVKYLFFWLSNSDTSRWSFGEAAATSFWNTINRILKWTYCTKWDSQNNEFTFTRKNSNQTHRGFVHHTRLPKVMPATSDWSYKNTTNTPHITASYDLKFSLSAAVKANVSLTQCAFFSTALNDIKWLQSSVGII